MGNKETGGSAFPMSNTSLGLSYDGGLRSQEWSHPGMNLRDWFAGQALVAASMYETVTPDELAHDAYAIADAMLKEREK